MRVRSKLGMAVPALALVACVLDMTMPAAFAGGTTGVPAPPVLPPSVAAPKAIGTLNGTNPVLQFGGAVQNPTPLPLVSDPAPPVCAFECKEFRFTAPTGVPFLVSIENTVTGPGGSFNADDGFDLYVYGPSGSLVGSSNGIGANGQAAAVDPARPGRYTVMVTITYAEDAKAAYAGEVRLMDGGSWQPPAATCGSSFANLPAGCYELPVLNAVPAYDLHVSGLPPVASTPLGFPFPVAVSTKNSCYVDESYGLESPSLSTLQHPTLRCLRFTSDVRDAGAGPLEVAIPWLSTGKGGSVQSGFLPGGCHAQQVVDTAGGGQVTRPAGDCEFHPEHGHFHYKDLVSFEMYGVAADGSIGAPVGTALKESFCLGDDDYFGFATPGPNGARGFVGQPGCNLPAQATGGSSGLNVLEGISPGWGDVYTWDTPDQYIDVTHMPAGTYDLVERTNPSGVLLVAGPTQTCALTQLKLTATSVTLLSTTDSVTCPAS